MTRPELPLALIFSLTLTLTVALAAPAMAGEDPPYLSVRPFAMIGEQDFAAVNTFNAVFGQRNEGFWGGGVSVLQEDRYYVDLTASKFKKSGQRAFRDANGNVFRLGIPVRTSLVPLELTGGYRFHFWSHVIPYAGGGVGLYHYKEDSDFAEPGENVDASHLGAVIEGGAEVRLHRWIGAGVDVHYTHVPGIIGTGGISKDVNENDLGGVSVRLRVLVGR
jgi:opacity protein-like surface antigen